MPAKLWSYFRQLFHQLLYDLIQLRLVFEQPFQKPAVVMGTRHLINRIKTAHITQLFISPEFPDQRGNG